MFRRSALRFTVVSRDWVRGRGCGLCGIAGVGAVDDGPKYGTRETGLLSHGGTFACNV